MPTKTKTFAACLVWHGKNDPTQGLVRGAPVPPEAWNALTPSHRQSLLNAGRVTLDQIEVD